MLGFPMEYMNITQGNNVGTHIGTNALDNAGKDAGIDPTFAPCDMHLVAYDSQANGNAVFFESNQPVLFRDGTVNYATFMFIHDNSISDIVAYANAGNTWKQGQEFGDEGTTGYATGNHVHMEVAKGKFQYMYARNGYGTYYLPNNVSADTAFVTDGTTIINKNTFRNWGSSNVIPDNKPKSVVHKIGYQAHVQNIGWQSPVYDGATAGTAGKSLRLEALKIFTKDGTLVEQVDAYIEGKGWVTYKTPSANTVIGTTGENRAILSLKIKTNKKCMFKIHRQTKGWTGWGSCNGKDCVNYKDKLRIEAIMIKRV